MIRAFLFTFFCLTFFLSYSQSGRTDYDKRWKKIDSFINQRLPKSALNEVRLLYALAKKEKKQDQLIKALIFTLSLQEETRENNAELSIIELEKEITSSDPVSSAILKNIVANAYRSYYQRNRWKFYSRTNTQNYNKADIDTWTTDDLFNKINSLYLSSLKDEKLLQQTSLSPFMAIINQGNMRHLRPTLFDLLAFEALGFYESGEMDIKKPAYAFELEQSEAFGNVKEFSRYTFTSKDSISSKFTALKIYQKIIKFHQNDKKPDALIDADIHRLNFVHSNSVHQDKDTFYLRALENITLDYKEAPVARLASYYIANWYQEKGNEFKPYSDSTHYLDLVKAKLICEKILKQKDSSEGKFLCYNLLQQLNKKNLSLKIEKVNSPGLDMRALVQYQNYSNLHFRVIQLNKTLTEKFKNTYSKDYWQTLAKEPTIKKWSITLPLPKDLQQHSAEIRVEALPVGEYLLLVSDQESMMDNISVMGSCHFYISSISFVNNNQDYFLLNRESGAPLKNAKVQVWEQEYDYSLSKYIQKKKENYNSDEYGHFRMTVVRTKNNFYNRSFKLEIKHESDSLFLQDNIQDYKYYGDETEDKSKNEIFLFTDRSIYRPGQQLFFKGIVINKENEKSAKVNAQYNSIIYLRNNNGEIIDSIQVGSNEFGSFQGKFKIPLAGLTGLFSIYTKNENASASFRVEEYKRPKFYVEFEALKVNYKVNDIIKLTGLAKAYAGNNIDGAKVSYRVVRKPRFIYSWMFWRWWQPQTSSMEIAHGETRTDKNGKFTVEFEAKPDRTIDRKFDPLFNYTIEADVTDINGETRSGEKQVSAGYKSIQLEVNIPESLPIDSLKKFYLFTSNMSGEFQPAQVRVNVTRMLAPNRLIRPRYWERPDQFLMSRDEYIRYFPHDEYDNETDPFSWPKEKKSLTRTDSSRSDGYWALNETFQPGNYEIIISAIDPKTGEEIKDIKYVELTGNTIPNKYLASDLTPAQFQPGDSARLKISSAAKNVFLISAINRSNIKEANPIYIYRTISEDKTTIDFPITEADRGGFGNEYFFVKNNRVFSENQVISVPWLNKDLDITYSSFRDKTLPGSKEIWKMRIRGWKGEKLAAEMLASMYDASLDQFYSHSWNKPFVWPYYYSGSSWRGNENFNMETASTYYFIDANYWSLNKQYDGLVHWNPYNDLRIRLRGMETAKEMPPPNQLNEVVVVGLDNKKSEKDGKEDKRDQTDVEDKEAKTRPEDQPTIRKNFNETAFFLPELKTDSTGAIEFSFTMPEALTRWKFMALAHTKDAAFGYSTKEIVTQKELMVQPNPPRFLREGDKIELNVKVVNLSDKEFTGIAELQLYNAATNEPVDGWFRNMIPKQFFTVAAGQSDLVKFPIEVPYLYNSALQWRVIAKTDKFSDGEENILPVLSNRMLITESMPLQIRGDGTKNYSFDKLKNADSSSSLQHQSLTVEYTSNPVWYAVQALPYLMEYPYECAEQSWNRYYANSLATWMVSSSPKIRQVFKKWKTFDTAALLSNLEKNQELKTILLEETPWVLAAKTETEQKKNLALLFDMVKMAEQLNSSYTKFKQMQSSNGGFVWFSGGPDDRYITQYIVTGIGHLMKLNSVAPAQQKLLDDILNTALPYLDRKIKEDYEELIKTKANLKNWQPGYLTIQYLYLRSFFKQKEIPAPSKTAFDYFKQRISKTWISQNKYMQAMSALGLSRYNEKETPAAILRSLKETSVNSEEMGMYYKDQARGWWWYQAPIETQSLIIEAFDEIANDTRTADDLRTWLIKNKQTNSWGTTIATAEACYAILLRGTQWLDNNPTVTIQLGSTILKSTDNKQEEGTGYFKTVIDGKNVRAEMGNINLTVKSSGTTKNTAPSWGAVYWQYFEDLDKITPAATPLSLKKKLFIEKNTDRGPVMTPVNEGDVIHIGDKIKVRIELRVDRPMEYVHMKDMRASSLEPVNVLSNYKWQEGLGYYESTRDASTNFFISYLPKGSFVFEYTLFATHAGNFSNGVTTIQCMYAPEFGAHSEGVRIDVEE